MLEENKQELSPEEKTDEVTLWYTPDEPREVVHCYVQPMPLPGLTEDEEAPKRRRKGLRIFLICVAAILLAVALGLLWIFMNTEEQEIPKDEDAASSIINIFRQGEKTTIPRCKGDDSVRLQCATPDGEVLSVQEVYAKVNPSVVVVVGTRGEKASIGTGIIMSEDGYIITNAHVIAGCSECLVATDIGQVLDAKLVGMDESEDIAVLKAQDAEDLIPAEFGDSNLAVVGDPVYAIGNPLGIKLRGTLTDGIISAINRDITVDGKTMTLLQTNAAINNGNSGGPLINAYGQVIGINTLKMGNIENLDASVEGLGFAIPGDEASYVVNDLIATGEFHGIPVIGVTVMTYTMEDGNTVAVIAQVSDQAAREGFREGDMIVSVDGQEISNTDELLAIRRNYRVGDEMILTVYREGGTTDISATLYANTEK